MPEAKLSSKNQIVIPREARRALRLKAGDKVQIVIREDRVLLLQTPKSYSAALRGIAQRRYPKDHLEKERQSWD